MAAGLKNRGYLDPYQCWKTWITQGSLNRVKEELYNTGVRHPRTDEPPTISGIEKAAFSWAIEPQNQLEARTDLSFAWEREGNILTDERWQEFLRNAAKLVYHQRNKKYEEFLRQNGLAR